MIFKKLDMTVAKMGTTLYSGNVEASRLKAVKIPANIVRMTVFVHII